MKKHSWILKRAAALLIALMLALSVLPAAMAVSPDWSQMIITVSWVDAETGETRSVEAVPVPDAEGSFWILLPPEAPMEGLTITVFHPAHEYQYDGALAMPVADAGEYLDGVNFTPFFVTDPATETAEQFNLYFSKATAVPVIGNADEIAAQKAAEEEAARLAAEQEAARKAAEEEAARKAEEEAALKAAEEEALRKAADRSESRGLAVLQKNDDRGTAVFKMTFLISPAHQCICRLFVADLSDQHRTHLHLHQRADSFRFYQAVLPAVLAKDRPLSQCDRSDCVKPAGNIPVSAFLSRFDITVAMVMVYAEAEDQTKSSFISGRQPL